MKKFNIQDDDHPTLFFSIEMGENIEYNFNGITLEVSILREQGGAEDLLFAPESVYLNGKLSPNSEGIPHYVYKLRIDPTNPFMCIEFSSNNDDIECSIRKDEKFEKEMLTELIDFEEKDYNGKHVMTFKVPENLLDQPALYFIVYYNVTGQEIDPLLTNYVFKYMIGNNNESFFATPHENDIVQYTILESSHEKSSYQLKFHAIQNYKVNYIVKAVYKESAIQNEVKDTIAISESPGKYWNLDNPKMDENNTITFNITDIENEVSYIKVLARVDNEANKMYLLYHPIEVSGDDDLGKPTEIELEKKDLQVIDFCTKNRRVIGHAEKVNKIQSYRIQFDFDNKILDYIKVETISKDQKNQDIYFSPTSEDGKTDRLQLGHSTLGNHTEMWIRKEQFEKEEVVDYFFVTVQCQEEESCCYDLQITSYKIPQIETSSFVHNYYVSENNTEMKFRVKNNLEVTEVSDQLLTVYAIGGKNVNISLENWGEEIEQYNFKIGSAITTHVKGYNYFEITVQAEIGDYISVGSKIIDHDGKTEENILIPNGHQLTGYLKKKLLDKECYSLPEIDNEKSEYYLTSLFYNKIAEIIFKDEQFLDIKNAYHIVNNGIYTYIHNLDNKKNKYICIGFPSNNDYLVEDIPFSIQLTEHNFNNNGFNNIFLPQEKGIIYPRITPVGSVVGFNAQNMNTENKDIFYNMLATKGYPQLFIYKCTNYPICDVDSENIESLEGIGRVSNWVNNKKDPNVSPIDAEQYIMFVLCNNISNLETNYCQFQTSIYEKGDDIHLLEGEPFSKIIYEGEEDTYVIDCTYEKKARKAHLDTLVLSGDVDFSITHETKGEYPNIHKYYLANKMFYTIPLEETTGIKQKIIISIKAKCDSYYNLEYKLIREDVDEKTNTIFEGINNLIPVPTMVGKNQKIINIYNRALLRDSKYLINFNSLNCKFKIKKLKNIIKDKDEELESIGHYSQKIIDEPTEIALFGHFFEISVEEQDPSKYANNMCMLYVNALQITEDPFSIAQKSILVADGVSQKMYFTEKVQKVRYSYPNANIHKNFTVNFKVLIAAEFNVTLSYNHKERETKIISKSEIFFVDNTKSRVYCNDNELCHISIEIQVIQIYNDILPACEVTFRQINNIPHYLSKEIVKNDFAITGNHLYLFTNIGEDDHGFVSFNFARGSGLIFGKIVKIEPTEEDENPIWRSYSFPNDAKDSLNFDFYSRKLLFTNEDTSICTNGCYLLLSIIPSVVSSYHNFIQFYQFTITVSLTPSGTLALTSPIIEMSPEEYVIGSLDIKEKIKAHDMYEFYSINIPFDTENIQFDWQSDAAILLVNVGTKRPNKNNYDFIFDNSRGDTIFELPKSKILKALNKEENYNIAQTPLTLGVYTEDIDSILYTTFAFRVHFQHRLDIIKVNSDQKSLCEPVQIEGDEEHYRCLFMVIYNEMDYINDLLIYSRSKNPAANVNMYANFTNNTIYESYDQECLQKLIPDENSLYNTKNEDLDFIFVPAARSFEIKKHLFVNVVTNKPDLIEFVTSMKSSEITVSPNPTSLQVFAINEKTLSLPFFTRKGLLIKLTSLYGSAKLIVSNDENKNYILRGRDDKLTLALPAKKEEGDIPSLYIQNLNDDQEPTSEDDIKPGFAFSLEYYLRSDVVNFDEVELGKTNEIAYPEVEFPISFYSKIEDLEHCVNIFFNLHDLEFSNPILPILKTEEFSIKGTLIEQNTAYKIKMAEEEAKPSIIPISGIYDPALKAGQIHFSYKDLKELSTNLKQPTLYVNIENTNDMTYKRLSMEFTAFQENNDIPVTEKLYQHGKIYEKNLINCYKLKVVHSLLVEGFMRIQFSSNNNNIKYAISDKINDKNNANLGDFVSQTKRGKTFITFKKPLSEFIYLNVYLDDKASESDVKINHYVFKYINADKKEDFFEYEIVKDDNIIVKEGQEKMNITFNKINKKNSEMDINYYIKVIHPDDYIQNELMNTISLTESKSSVILASNTDSNEVFAQINKVKYKCIQVIAYIKDGPINEYVAYNAFIPGSSKPDSGSGDKGSGSGKSTSFYVIIGISIALFVIIVVLIVIIIVFNSKNKDLVDKVNKISFVSSDNKPNSDSNLLMDDNELQ